MPKKNDFKLDVVSVRLVKDAPIYSEHTYGIDVSAEEIRTTETETLKTTVREKVEVR